MLVAHVKYNFYVQITWLLHYKNIIFRNHQFYGDREKKSHNGVSRYVQMQIPGHFSFV